MQKESVLNESTPGTIFLRNTQRDARGFTCWTEQKQWVGALEALQTAGRLGRILRGERKGCVSLTLLLSSKGEEWGRRICWQISGELKPIAQVHIRPSVLSDVLWTFCAYMVIIKERFGSAQGWIDEAGNSWGLKWSFSRSSSHFVPLAQNGNEVW